MTGTPPESTLGERISYLVENAPKYAGDDFAVFALPLLMEADNEIDRLRGLVAELLIGRERPPESVFEEFRALHGLTEAP